MGPAMQEFIIVLVVAVVAFVVGFFVGKKHGIRVALAAKTLKDTVGKL